MNRGFRNELILLTGLGVLAALRLKDKRPAIALAAAGAGLFALSPRVSSDSFKGQAVIITGGSRGLGFALAQELAREGAKVALLARDTEELERAKEKLLAEFPQAEVLIITCDVTNSEGTHIALKMAAETFGGIDMLINNAGAITVGPYETMRPQDFTAQMDLHFYAIMQTVNSALPFLRKSAGRRIVNICSMGGKTAVPHMLPYDVSKFALSGYSQGLMAELAKENISVTTVYPALMRTGSPIQAVFKGDHEKEYLWFAAGDSMPGVSACAHTIAKKVLEAARDRRAELVPSLLGKVRGLAAAICPETMAALMKLMASLMPEGKSLEYKTGAQSNALFKSNPLTKPLQKFAEQAEADLNQQPKSDPKFNMGLH
jgi:short-subunit dehydrogenase